MASAYVLDPTTNVVTDAASGKEWLQWTETTGMSVTDDISSFSGGGWSVATNADMAALYGDFFTEVTWIDDENNDQKTRTQLSDRYVWGDGRDQSLVFGDLFGWTQYENSGFGLYSTYAWFGDDADLDDLYNLAGVRSEHGYYDGNGWFDYIPESQALYSDRVSSPGSTVGVALVRGIGSVSVSEPSSLALFGLGLVGLGAVRRKSKA